MKLLYAMLCALPIHLMAQTNWPVQVGGSTVGGTPPFYSPQFLTIEVGDMVTWTNTSGTHNVTGTTDIFPDNPEGFSSGEPASGGWMFSHTFTIPGFYEYHCTQQGHAATQFGTITVLNTMGIDGPDEPRIRLTLYPVPVSDILVAEISERTISSIEVFDLDGRSVMIRSGFGTDRIEIDTTELQAGQYYLRIRDSKDGTLVRPFRKE